MNLPKDESRFEHTNMVDSKLRTEADAVHEQTLLGIQPQELLPGKIYAVRTRDGYRELDLTADCVLQSAGLPRKKLSSHFVFHNVESFVSYARNLFDSGAPSATVFHANRREAMCFADESTFSIRLIFDAQPFQWSSIIADLKLQVSPETQRWMQNSGKYLSQIDFAEFCELNLDSFQHPTAATILEIAQTFQAKTTVDFQSAVRLANGSIKLKREEEVKATAGANITIPEELRLALKLFKYDQPYEVKARLRYRIVESTVRLSVLLIDPEYALEHAFSQIVSKVSDSLELPVHMGRV